MKLLFVCESSSSDDESHICKIRERFDAGLDLAFSVLTFFLVGSGSFSGPAVIPSLSVPEYTIYQY